MNLIATLTREAFNEACAALPQADADIIAETYPHLFSAYFTYNARAADARPTASPGPAKAREPKAAPAVDKEALAAQVFAYVAHNSGRRGEDIALAVGPSVPRDEAQSFARTVRGILERFVADGKMYADGERRGRRYKVAVKATEPEAAE